MTQREQVGGEATRTLGMSLVWIETKVLVEEEKAGTAKASKPAGQIGTRRHEQPETGQRVTGHSLAWPQKRALLQWLEVLPYRAATLHSGLSEA